LGGGAHWHVLPSRAALLQVALELVHRPFALRTGIMTSSTAHGGLLTGEVAAWVLGSRLDACWLSELGSVGVQLCAGSQAGAVRMEGRGYLNQETTVRPWLSLSARAAVEWPQEILRGRLFVEGVAPLLNASAQVVDEQGNVLAKLTTVRAGVILGAELVVMLH
jgi:hypothetical protein